MLDMFNVLACEGTFSGSGIPGGVANLIHLVYVGIKIVIPILLIIFGMIDLGKAITSQKEDEIKKAQSGFFKKLILAVLVFLVFSIVQWVVKLADNAGNDTTGEEASGWSCVNELLNGSSSKKDGSVTGN